MVLRIVRGKNLPIGVDLGTSAVKMAQLHCVNGDLSLIDARTEPLAEVHDDLDARLAAAVPVPLRLARNQGSIIRDACNERLHRAR